MKYLISSAISSHGGRKLLGATLSFLLLPALALAQTSPTDYVRANVDAVLAVLNNPEYAGNQELKVQQIALLADSFFDAQELSKRALGQYWKTFREDQRREFQELFVDLLKSTYLKKTALYNNEKVVYNRETLKSDTLAEVHTTLTSPKLSVPVVYFLIRRDGKWGVYDVAVENVSLVRNYRSQFQSILQNNSPDQLMGILREKTHE